MNMNILANLRRQHPTLSALSDARIYAEWSDWHSGAAEGTFEQWCEHIHADWLDSIFRDYYASLKTNGEQVAAEVN